MKIVPKVQLYPICTCTPIVPKNICTPHRSRMDGTNNRSPTSKLHQNEEPRRTRKKPWNHTTNIRKQTYQSKIQRSKRKSLHSLKKLRTRRICPWETQLKSQASCRKRNYGKSGEIREVTNEELLEELLGLEILLKDEMELIDAEKSQRKTNWPKEMKFVIFYATLWAGLR